MTPSDPISPETYQEWEREYYAAWNKTFIFKNKAICECYNHRAVFEDYIRVDPRTKRTYANPTMAGALSNCVKRWREIRTASYMDEAIAYCDMHDLPILPSLMKNIADAARARMSGKTTKGMREGVKDAAHRMIANLIYHDDTLADAAGRTAVWSQDTPHPMKASSLEKTYTTEFRSGTPTQESILWEFWEDEPDPQLTEIWRKLRLQIPLPDDEIKGNRRQ